MHALHQALRRVEIPALRCVHRISLSAETDLSLSGTRRFTASACACAVGDSTRTGSLDLFDRFCYFSRE